MEKQKSHNHKRCLIRGSEIKLVEWRRDTVVAQTPTKFSPND